MAQNLSNKDQMLVYLAARGHKNSEICDILSISPSAVSVKLQDETIQFEIKHLRYKLYGKDHKKRFMDILPTAIDGLEEIVSDASAKPQLRFSAIQEALDRALGKPKQTIEHEGNLIKELFDKLDGKKESDIIDVARTMELPPAVEAPKEEGNSIDQWVKKNI